jgi:signal transduction histidine kinase/DNA-binding response OmpR family regulator/streptogramin lyase
MWKLLTSVFFGVLITATLNAQTKNSISNQNNQVLKGQFWGIDAGLSHRQVNSIIQDDQDLMWLATDYGINRFDGKEFKWFTAENSGLQNNAVEILKKDQQGFIWIFYNDLNKTKLKSIDILDPEKEEIKPIQEFLSDSLPFDFSEVRTINLNESKEIIFVTSRSLFYYSDRFYEVPLRGLDVTNLRSMERSPNGNIWLSFYMLYPSNSNFKIINPQGELLDSIGFKESNYVDIYEWDSLGRAHFLIFYQRNDAEEPWQDYYTFKEGESLQEDSLARKRFGYLKLENNYNRRFFIKFKGLYWTYSRTEKMMVVPEDVNQKAIDLRDVSEGIRNGRSIYLDGQGAVWLCTAYGVYRFTMDDLRFRRHFYEADRLDTRSIRGIEITGKGAKKKLWAMSELPRHLYSQELPSGISKEEESFVSGKWALSSNRDSSLLYMTDLGLKVNNPSKPYLDRLYPISVKYTGGSWLLHQDKYGFYWFNNHFTASLFRFKDDNLQEFPRWHGLDENPYAYQFIENDSDTAWLVTARGIFSLDLKSGAILEHYWSKGKAKYFLKDDNIQHILANKDGTFWLATATAGLQKWSPERGQIKQYSRLEGLPSNNVYAVYRDDNENLWLSTEYGIAQCEIETNKIRSYTQQDGLGNNEFNRLSHYQDGDGTIYFGGLNGITSFHPSDFYAKEEYYEPNLVLNELKVYKAKKNAVLDFGYETKLGQTLEISPGDYIRVLSVALLSYEEQEKVQYAYILEGLDQDWTYQVSNVIQLGKIPYGDFILKIKAQEAGGRWSQKQLSLNISVLKPFYLEKVFIMSIILMVLFLIFLFFELRRRLQLAQQKELEKLVIERTQTIEEQKEDLRSLDRMKSRFFANISHELRTPLTLISTPLKKLINEGKGFDAKEKRWLTYMHRNADVLLGLVNEILDLSKLEEGKLELNLEKVALFQHFEVLMEPFKTIAKEKRIAFNWQINFDPKLLVEIDKTKVDKVITNLLSNAFKFTNAGGSVNVNIRPDGEDQLFISIKDNGLGIKQDELNKVFERFYQAKPSADSELVEAHGGTGLGLTLSKDLAELMQGQLWVESEWQKGSTFYFKLPYRLASGQAEMPIEDFSNDSQILNSFALSTEEEDSSKPHLLVVEDNPELLSFLKDLLQTHYRITVAENGAIAWRLLKSTQEKGATEGLDFDLVLSDQMMPVLDGLSLLNKLKQDPELSLLPFIMLTARTEAKLKISALKVGVNDFLTKPFEEEELLLRIENLLVNQKVRLETIAEELASESQVDENPQDTKSRVKHKGHTKEEELWLERFDTFIKENLNNSDLKVSEIAYHFAMSDSTLLRQVKKLTGLSPQKYLQEARLQKALVFIEEEEFSNLSNLSIAVGFSDLASFSRSFKMRFGKSPSKFTV